MQGEFAAFLYFTELIAGDLNGCVFEICQHQHIGFRGLFGDTPDFRFELKRLALKAVILLSVVALDLATG